MKVLKKSLLSITFKLKSNIIIKQLAMLNKFPPNKVIIFVNLLSPILSAEK